MSRLTKKVLCLKDSSKQKSKTIKTILYYVKEKKKEKKNDKRKNSNYWYAGKSIVCCTDFI